MPPSSSAKSSAGRSSLIALHKRLASEQERLLLEAAESGSLPPEKLLDRVARNEMVLSAIEAIVEDAR